MIALAENKKVFFEYEILETYEAGIILLGQEVKSIRLGHAQLAGSYVVVKEEELWLVGATVPPYQPKNAPADYNPQRPRKLLLQKSEINYLLGKAQQKGLTLVPIKMYTKHDKIKLLFGIARGRKKRGKKELLKKRAVVREVHRELRARG
ncbi:MAG: SsrA-binding protein [Candidatus Wildermuthbacteria bacterium RIFCSPHIGHO2_01_FULL_47_27]|uniref:SsrA-binding protein n=2 Tax=Candidatus Wildermuthiibacteriota TaxID=1817923 RepID=A0A1G2RP11_9BACT|nr:MAG: SsrA-binding protein [Parcubacteria group bacterium GW2011_GWA2_47_9]OHA63514.1 MAG: SsrA-binding protein [Candidatus Wildermuthbacteria bacterium RIFCSPHIGHO2_01_FULL_47_27]OHA67721.1 MAG: SsrA-binding protein [Candidatus Wildermuthbacteria bacterium RIFCSPHIGHO2_02_FULL_47_17]OHA74002.1 MAG: SsrA-binding protein [Candidatus Wildermuthbacteria bacterium RIFCSPLOWO2_01_FULL_48_35]